MTHGYANASTLGICHLERKAGRRPKTLKTTSSNANESKDAEQNFFLENNSLFSLFLPLSQPQSDFLTHSVAIFLSPSLGGSEGNKSGITQGNILLFRGSNFQLNKHFVAFANQRLLVALIPTDTDILTVL